VLARAALAWAALAGGAAAQEDAPMQLTTRFTGEGRCLDVVNDGGRRDRLVMADCGNYSGQYWVLMTEPGTRLERFQNAFSGGDMCLDVINDGANDRVHMAPCGNYSGQMWLVDPVQGGQGAVRLTNTFTGPGRCLDIVNDGANDRLTLADCGNYSGQMWVMHSTDLRPAD
jgi:hypothetical protein